MQKNLGFQEDVVMEIYQESTLANYAKVSLC